VDSSNREPRRHCYSGSSLLIKIGQINDSMHGIEPKHPTVASHGLLQLVRYSIDLLLRIEKVSTAHGSPHTPLRRGYVCPLTGMRSRVKLRSKKGAWV
jgi:hypothetical protein